VSEGCFHTLTTLAVLLSVAGKALQTSRLAADRSRARTVSLAILSARGFRSRRLLFRATKLDGDRERGESGDTVCCRRKISDSRRAQAARSDVADIIMINYNTRA
jgi:hypothetical protein